MDQTTQPNQPMSLQEIINLRERVLKGEEISREQLRRAIDGLRNDRVTAATASAAKSKKTAPVAIDLASLFAKNGATTESAK